MLLLGFEHHRPLARDAAQQALLLPLVGTAFLLPAAITVLRIPDLFMRLSASSTPVSLGTGVMFIGVGVYFGDTGVFSRAVAGMGFFLLTSPAQHASWPGGHHVGIPYWQKTVNTPPCPRRSDAQTPGQVVRGKDEHGVTAPQIGDEPLI